MPLYAAAASLNRSPCQKPARRAFRSSVQRKRVAEHRPTALGLLLSRLVLDDVPMLDEDPVLNPKDVRRDPVDGRPESRKTSMDNDKIALSHDHSRLVFQCWRDALDEGEESFPTRGYVCAVLDIVG